MRAAVCRAAHTVRRVSQCAAVSSPSLRLRRFVGPSLNMSTAAAEATGAVPLKPVLAALERIAPLRLAASWDNVGLLVEPRWAAEGTSKVEKILLCNDLTRPVMDEAIKAGANLIVSYHPPIFAPLKRLRWAAGGNEKEQIVMSAAVHEIAVFSPHTACDSAAGGVNDWLADGLGERKEGTVAEPLEVFSEASPGPVKVVVFVPSDAVDRIRTTLVEQAGAGIIGDYTHCSFSSEGHGSYIGDEQKTTPQAAGAQAGRLEKSPEVRLEMVLPSKSSVAAATRAIWAVHPYEEPAFEFYPLEPVPLLVGERLPNYEDRLTQSADQQRFCGMGRRLQLREPASLETIVERVKARTGVPRLRVAVGEGRSASAVDCSSIALCAGSGWSLLRGSAGKADVLLSGEMGHHDVLNAVAKGSHVILCEHSNSERGYLKDVLQAELAAELKGVSVVVSEVDADPLVSM
jgi:dinuclear metal center YbgI/SA1388 family protein